MVLPLKVPPPDLVAGNLLLVFLSVHFNIVDLYILEEIDTGSLLDLLQDVLEADPTLTLVALEKVIELLSILLFALDLP